MSVGCVYVRSPPLECFHASVAEPRGIEGRAKGTFFLDSNNLPGQLRGSICNWSSYGSRAAASRLEARENFLHLLSLFCFYLTRRMETRVHGRGTFDFEGTVNVHCACTVKRSIRG